MSLRPVAPLLTVFVLAGCGAVHPGQAAVVGGHQISLQQADTTAHIYCALVDRSAPGAGQVSYATVRRQAVSDLVFARIADDLAGERGIKVPATDYAMAPKDVAALRRAFSPREAKVALGVARRNERTFATAGRLGAKTGRSAAAAQEAGFRLIEREARTRDVQIDPRFGLGDGVTRLSVPDDAYRGRVAPAAAGQVCPA